MPIKKYNSRRTAWLWTAAPSVACLTVASLLSSCASRPPPVPVEEVRTVAGQRMVPFNAYSAREGVYTVQTGDTLFDIAYRYDTSVQKIIQRNGLLQSHLIYPGQKLIIKNTNKKPVRQSNSVIKTPLWSRLNPYGYKFQKNNEKLIQLRDGNSRSNKVLIEWKWPAKGEVVKQFNQGKPPNQGVDIAGRYGDPVYAAAAGTVVYKGEGLRGFGKMVILLHSNGYLTAYGNNRRIRVRESQAVKAGEKIATIGASASGKSELHFEIRFSGKPIDPLKYLPVRD